MHVLSVCMHVCIYMLYVHVSVCVCVCVCVCACVCMCVCVHICACTNMNMIVCGMCTLECLSNLSYTILLHSGMFHSNATNASAYNVMVWYLLVGQSTARTVAYQ